MEKVITSKLLKPGANKRISTVDRNIGVVGSGQKPVDQDNQATLTIVFVRSPQV